MQQNVDEMRNVFAVGFTVFGVAVGEFIIHKILGGNRMLQDDDDDDYAYDDASSAESVAVGGASMQLSSWVTTDVFLR